MTITTTPDHQSRILHTVSRGTVTLQQIEHYQNTVWLEPSIYGYNELYDVTKSDYSSISFSELIGISQTASHLYMIDPNSRFAFLTATQNHIELAEFYMAARSLSKTASREIRSFQSRSDALEWLSSRP
ncbi:MAG: hypothetical protein OEY36_04075 [Gammaproteobacteria bacterium]|nr:hypothetical protein [Gammaproteobacteria bacterium]